MIHHKKSKTVFEEDVFQYLFPTAGSQQFLTQVQLRRVVAPGRVYHRRQIWTGERCSHCAQEVSYLAFSFSGLALHSTQTSFWRDSQMIVS